MLVEVDRELAQLAATLETVAQVGGELRCEEQVREAVRRAEDVLAVPSVPVLPPGNGG